MITWPKVCRPKELGGLGILDLQYFGWALRVRWLWLEKTEPNKPWAAFPMSINKNAQALFSMALTTTVGSGSQTKFWTDRWLNGKSIELLAPIFLLVFPKGVQKIVWSMMRFGTTLGFMISKGTTLLQFWLNIWKSGRWFRKWFCNLK